MEIPQQLLYTRDHEWVEQDPVNGRYKMGITDYAQDALGDIVFVQLPEVGAKVQAGSMFGEVESTKSVSDIYGPISGTVTEINSGLGDSPQSINEHPYGNGWICIIEPDADANRDHLIDAAAYGDLVGE